MFLIIGANTIVYAQEPLSGDQAVFRYEPSLKNTTTTDTTYSLLYNDISQVKFRGIWGYKGFNQTIGYLGGVLVKPERVVVIKGAWNTTDNFMKGNIVGILKRGYFNGRIITQNQTIGRIVGLYRYNAEKTLLNLYWMTTQQIGWAHCRILVE